VFFEKKLKKISTFNVVKNTTLGLSCVWKKKLKKKLSRLMLLKKLFKKKKMFNPVKITTLGLTCVLTTLA
jgi:hypothetical protein